MVDKLCSSCSGKSAGDYPIHLVAGLCFHWFSAGAASLMHPISFGDSLGNIDFRVSADLP